MPTPPVTADKLAVGAKSNGKHWTASEVAARQEAGEQVQRKHRVTMKAPAWVKENPETLKVWQEIREKLKGIELLDNLDTELLAVYCDAIVNYRESSKQLKAQIYKEGEARPAPVDDLVKIQQAWARIMVSFAEKLGLTPGGRARLAKKKAEKIVDLFEEKFGG